MTDTPTPDLDARAQEIRDSLSKIRCSEGCHCWCCAGKVLLAQMDRLAFDLNHAIYLQDKVREERNKAEARAEHAEADLIALKTEREQIVRAFDDVSPVDESEKPLVQHLKDELADFAMVIDHCSVIYDNASGGRISKPNTLPREVIAQMEERIEEQVREAVAEETEELRAAKDAAEGRLTALRRCSTREIVMDAADRKALGHNPAWIKAVDVEEALTSAAPTTEPGRQ